MNESGVLHPFNERHLEGAGEPCREKLELAPRRPQARLTQSSSVTKWRRRFYRGRELIAGEETAALRGRGGGRKRRS